MIPFKIAKKTKIYVSLALVLLCNPVIATTADLSQIIRLANQGYVQSQFNLGLMYAQGRGIGQNYQKALEWYQKAANQEDALAQNMLGMIYKNGEGVPQDYQGKRTLLAHNNQVAYLIIPSTLLKDRLNTAFFIRNLD